jgi:tetratricopeptide (TPR) repeat protein
LTAAISSGYRAAMPSRRVRSLSTTFAVSLAVLIVGCLPLPLVAQSPQGGPNWPGDAPRPDPPKSLAPQPGQRGSALPKTPAEREKMLSDLYALLATADSEDSAKAVAEAIERIWLYSGSPTVDLLMERAFKAVAEKKLDVAITFLNRVVDMAPDYAEAFNRRAYVNFMRNDFDHALGDLRRVLALDPSHFKALEGLGQILRDIGQKKPALKAFRQLLAVHPYWPGAKEAIEELERDVDGQGI